MKSGWCQNTQNLSIQVSNGMDTAGIRSQGLTWSPVFEMFEAKTLNIVDQLLVSRVNMKLFQNFNQNQAKDELNSCRKMSKFSWLISFSISRIYYLLCGPVRMEEQIKTMLKLLN